MMFLLLKKETQTSSKPVYLDSMETRVYFKPDIIVLFKELIVQYRAWYRYVTEEKQVEIAKMEFPQTES